MLKKTITYTDYNGQSRTEDFFFNLSTAEIVEMELRENLSGGLKSILEQVIASNDGRRIMDTFKDIISRSYGIKSEDGRDFKKSAEISSGFLGSEAYSQFFMELIGNPDAASAFITAIVPADLGKQVDAQGRMKPMDRLPSQTKEEYKTVELPKENVPNTFYTQPQTQPEPVDPERAEFEAWRASQKTPTIPRPPHESGPHGE